jgi:hypothetical protein
MEFETENLIKAYLKLNRKPIRKYGKVVLPSSIILDQTKISKDGYVQHTISEYKGVQIVQMKPSEKIGKSGEKGENNVCKFVINEEKRLTTIPIQIRKHFSLSDGSEILFFVDLEGYPCYIIPPGEEKALYTTVHMLFHV